MPVPMERTAPRRARSAPVFEPADDDVACPWCHGPVGARLADCPTCRHTVLVPGQEASERRSTDRAGDPRSPVGAATLVRVALVAVVVLAAAALLADLAHVFLLRRFLERPTELTEANLLRSEDWQSATDLLVLATVSSTLSVFTAWRGRLPEVADRSRLLASPRRHDVWWAMVTASVGFAAAAWFAQSGLPLSPNDATSAVRTSVVLQIPAVLFLLVAALLGFGVLRTIEHHHRA